jgi:hypothetical protein
MCVLPKRMLLRPRIGLQRLREIFDASARKIVTSMECVERQGMALKKHKAFVLRAPRTAQR